MCWTRFVFVYTGIWVFIVGGSSSLHDVRISSPAFIRRGEDGNLTCAYDLGNETLYAVKWYRNNQEFYRYVPKEVPPQQVFPQQWISVDAKKSTDHSVILVKVTFEGSGKYKCVVSAEGTFKTLTAAQNVTVVAIDRSSPVLHLDQDSYHVGELGRASCSKNSTFPPVNLTWYINDREVNKSKPVVVTTKDKVDGRLSSVLSTLYFAIPPDFLPLTLRCRARLYNVYEEASATVIQPKPRIVPILANNIAKDAALNSTTRSNSTKYFQGLFSKSSEPPQGPPSSVRIATTLLLIIAKYLCSM